MPNSQPTDQTFYDILEVSENAGPVEIYQAYQRAKSTYSPTSTALYSMFTPEEAKALMSLIEEAYQTLSNQGRRKQYDAKLGIGNRKDPEIEKRSFVVHDGGEGAKVTITTSREELPDGFKKTRYSVYEIKPEFERQIQELKECDGSMLQKIRLYKGVSLDQISSEIRASKAVLVALEANDLEALPVAVFTRGFVVHYARALGVDEKTVAEAYMVYFRKTRG